MDDWRLFCFADHHVLTLFPMRMEGVSRVLLHCCSCCLVEDALHVVVAYGRLASDHHVLMSDNGNAKRMECGCTGGRWVCGSFCRFEAC